MLQGDQRQLDPFIPGNFIDEGVCVRLENIAVSIHSETRLVEEEKDIARSFKAGLCVKPGSPRVRVRARSTSLLRARMTSSGAQKWQRGLRKLLLRQGGYAYYGVRCLPASFLSFPSHST